MYKMESDKEQFLHLCNSSYTYIDKVIKLLRYSTIRCEMHGVYMAIWVYTCDIILLTPSSRTGGLQENAGKLWKKNFKLLSW